MYYSTVLGCIKLTSVDFSSSFQTELMLFGLLSLLMGHWIIFVAKICVESSALSSRFFPCAIEKSSGTVDHFFWSISEYSNKTVVKEQVNNGLRNYCPEVNFF